MAGRVTVLSPINNGTVVELGRKLFRKQLLPLAEIDYKGRKLNFDRAYLANVARSFKERAFDTVPLVMADSENRHTMSPTAITGEIVGVELTETGLDVIASADEATAKVLSENPKVGISARIVEQLTRSDGATWPAALQHALITADPRIAGMKPWQAVECANETAEVIDLSALTFTPDGEAVTPAPSATPGEVDTKEAGPVAPLTDDELAQIRAVAPLFKKLAEVADVTEPAVPTLVKPVEPAEPEFTEAELDAMTAGVEVDETELIAASNDDELRSALELANARVDSQALQLARVQAKLDETAYETERDQLARDFGVPPRITDLARPLLMGSGHTVELSNGTSTDAGDIVRKVIREMGTAFGLLDLSAPVGTAHELAAGVAEQAERDAFIDQARASGFAK